MNWTQSTIAVAAFVAASLQNANSGWAADSVAPDSCSVHGAVWGSYAYQNVELSGPPEFDFNGHGPSAAASGLLTCGGWNGQLDGVFAASFSDFGDVIEGSAGGKLFWRQPEFGALGVFASYGLGHAEDVSEIFGETHIDIEAFSAGLFGQYYWADNVTIGLSGGMVFGDINDKSFEFLEEYGAEGWFVDAAVKVYIDPQIAFVLNGGYAANNIDDDWLLTEAVTVGGGAEYLFANSGVAVFGGASLAFDSAGVEGDSGPRFWVDSRTITIFAGLRYDFGAPPASLVSRDRSGPVTFSLLP